MKPRRVSIIVSIHFLLHLRSLHLFFFPLLYLIFVLFFPPSIPPFLHFPPVVLYSSSSSSFLPFSTSSLSMFTSFFPHLFFSLRFVVPHTSLSFSPFSISSNFPSSSPFFFHYILFYLLFFIHHLSFFHFSLLSLLPLLVRLSLPFPESLPPCLKTSNIEPSCAPLDRWQMARVDKRGSEERAAEGSVLCHRGDKTEVMTLPPMSDGQEG